MLTIKSVCGSNQEGHAVYWADYTQPMSKTEADCKQFPTRPDDAYRAAKSTWRVIDPRAPTIVDLCSGGEISCRSSGPCQAIVIIHIIQLLGLKGITFGVWSNSSITSLGIFSYSLVL